MRMMVLDSFVSEDLIARRRKLGTAFHDEVWDGTYVAPPAPNVDHQDLVGKLCRVIATALPDRKRDKVLPGANVSERDGDWEHDYRVPDVVVVLAGGRAVNRGTHL